MVCGAGWWLGAEFAVHRCRHAGLRIFGKGDKSVGYAIERVDRALPDVVNPSMQGHAAFLKSERNGRMGLDVCELGDDIVTDQGVEASLGRRMLTRGVTTLADSA